MSESGRRSEEKTASTAGVLCEQYLPQVLQYLNFWVDDSGIAEELTLKTLKKALTRHNNCSGDKKKFSRGVFACARNEVLDYLKKNPMRPVLPGLSAQERDVISLRLAAVVDNRMIAALLGLSEAKVCLIIRRSLGKLSDCLEDPEN